MMHTGLQPRVHEAPLHPHAVRHACSMGPGMTCVGLSMEEGDPVPPQHPIV